MSQASSLLRIRQYIDTQKQQKISWWIPSIWNECGYEHILEEKNGEIRVQPYSFLSEHLNYLFKLAEQEKPGGPVDFHDSVIYSSLVRYSTTWDYDHDGELESGTFLRLMLLLPHMKKMGVNILYMLPVTKYSTLNLKGDIGSPYAVKSLFELDPNLHDPLLDGLNTVSLDDQLTALVEACHMLDIRVVNDFIPRVTAKNSDFIEDHPDWVYWMKMDQLEGFRPPDVPELGFFEECTPDKLDTVYRSKDIPAFLDKFSHSPDRLNPTLWQELKNRAAATGEELLTLVEQEMGITTAPAHSDWINDVQPIWTDICFLRLYKDFAPPVRQYLQQDQAPYVLFDTIKCNYYPGEEPNQELWDVLEQAVRHQMTVYGLDGFRVDIGHTLPVPLLARLFEVIRELNPHALLISEDLFNHNHEKASVTGYNIMLGSGWNVMSRISKESLLEYLESLPELKIRIFACAETPDTPRITSREGGKRLARLIGVFNHFLPNGIPFITTGFEVNEKQPLNCGLADNTNGAEIPRAFFNKMKIDWLQNTDMLDLLEQLNQVKKQYKTLIRPENFFKLESEGDIIVYGYRNEKEQLVCCFNISMTESLALQLDSCLQGYQQFNLALDNTNVLGEWKLSPKTLEPGQAVVITAQR